MSSVKTTQLDGDVSIGRHVAIGGNTTVQGNGHIKGRLKIDGWLEAKNIKGESTDKGIFTTLEKLKAAYPLPKDGWWALVGNTLPCPIYVAEGGEWVATGGNGGSPTIDSDKYEKQVESLQEDIKKNKEEIEGLKKETEKQGKTVLQLSSGLQDTINQALQEDAKTRKKELDSLRDLVNSKENFKSTVLTEEEYRGKVGQSSLEADRFYFTFEE